MMLILLLYNPEETFQVNGNALTWYFKLNENRPVCVHFLSLPQHRCLSLPFSNKVCELLGTAYSLSSLYMYWTCVIEKKSCFFRNEKVQIWCPFSNTNVPFTTQFQFLTKLYANDVNPLVFFPNWYFIDYMTFSV